MRFSSQSIGYLQYRMARLEAEAGEPVPDEIETNEGLDGIVSFCGRRNDILFLAGLIRDSN